MLTIDASVWVSANSPAERECFNSRELIDRAALTGIQVVVPTLLVAEAAAAVRRTRNNALLARTFADGLLSLEFTTWIKIDLVVAQTAANLAAEHGLRGADAVYAAVAQIHGCALISLDREHLSRMNGVLPVYTPAQVMGMAEIWERK